MPPIRRMSFVLVLLSVLVACGGSQPDTVSWRNVTLDVPDGWYVFEEEETRLSLSNADIGADTFRSGELEEGAEVSAEDAAPTDVVAMFFTFEPRTLPDDWRAYAQEQDATIESDDQILLGDEVPATRLVFEYVTDGIPLREMVVVIPSRGIVALAQPVPTRGRQDGPEVFLDHVDTFLEVLETAEFGPPVME